MYKVIPLLLCAIIMLSFTACKKVNIDGVTASTPSTSQSDIALNVHSDTQLHSQPNESSGDKTTSSGIKVEDDISSVISDANASDNSLENIDSDLENSTSDNNDSSNQVNTNNSSQENESNNDIGTTSQPFQGEEDEFDSNFGD